MIDQIIQAFHDTRDGYSIDRVIAGPGLNRSFVAACRNYGLNAETDQELNRSLLNLRKSGRLGKLSAKRTSFDDDDYRFAVEISVRHIERRENVTLDDVLISPRFASEFDALCRALAPGYSPLMYRWSALRLRKTRRLRPEVIGHAIKSEAVKTFKTQEIDLSQLPARQGLYVFYSKSLCLYVGEASQLKSRLTKHLQHSDNKLLAQWFWQYGNEEVFLEVHILPQDTSPKTRKALEAELICSRRPAFNIVGRKE